MTAFPYVHIFQVKGQIEEAFHSYKALLEQRREALMGQLEASHKRQELAIMELFHSVEKTIEKIEDGTKFAQRIVDNGNAPAILSVKKLVVDQLLYLISATPNPNLDVHLEFETNMGAFGDAVLKHFGYLKAPAGSLDSSASSAASLANNSFDVHGVGSLTSPHAASRFPAGGPAGMTPGGAAPQNVAGFVGNSPPRPFGGAIVGRENPAPGANEDLASIFLNANNNNNSNNAQFSGSARFRNSGFDDAPSVDAALAANNNNNNNSGQFGANLGLGSRVGAGGAFAPYPNESGSRAVTTVTSVANFKQPSAVTAGTGRTGASLLNADISTLSESQLSECMQQVGEQLGGAFDVSSLSPSMLANLAEGLAGTNILGNIDSLISMLGADSGAAATSINDVATSIASLSLGNQVHPQQQRPSPLPGHIAQQVRQQQQQQPPHPQQAQSRMGATSSTSPPGAHLHHGDHRSASRNSHSPSLSESGISMDGSSQSGGSAGSGNASIATRLGLAGNTVGNTGLNGGSNEAMAQALFKGGNLGGVSINPNGQICLNGQVIPGVNINHLSSPAMTQLLDALPGMGAASGVATSVASGQGLDSPHQHIPANSRALR